MTKIPPAKPLYLHVLYWLLLVSVLFTGLPYVLVLTTTILGILLLFVVETWREKTSVVLWSLTTVLTVLVASFIFVNSRDLYCFGRGYHDKNLQYEAFVDKKVWWQAYLQAYRVCIKSFTLSNFFSALENDFASWSHQHLQ